MPLTPGRTDRRAGRVARWLGRPGTTSFRRFEHIVDAANQHAAAFRALEDRELRDAAARLKLRTGASLDPEPTARFLAIAKESAARSVGLTAFDEQVMACCALLAGFAVEMDTGEGKTLVGAMAAAGHALAGRRVHLLAVNDYLAERDAAWMHGCFELLGIGVGWVGQHSTPAERRAAYRLPVVYAPVSEIGFDVLRDRFAVRDDERVHPAFDVAIVDEADAVMIDEAMVPLVLAGESDGPGADLAEATRLVEGLRDGEDFTVDADRSTVTLTDAGLDRLEAELGGINVYDAEHVGTLTSLHLALHAHALVRHDVDYLVTEDGIRIINTGRGRVAHLQRWPDGLHAAIEAKEGLTISAAGEVLDQLTVQDLLLQYRSLAGMSGTVLAVAEELMEFYRLPSGRVERHRPNARVDEADLVLDTAAARRAALVARVRERHETGQPVLVGTQTVAESEEIAAALQAAGLNARVLNAKNDADEAAVIARAGELGAITISTQMSGRGTDIRLGGADERDRDRALAAGGLAVILVGRFPSRRLDAQLRGRAGRQGDPGSSLALISLDDDLIQANAPEHLLAKIDRRGSSLSQPERQRLVDTAQRIAEGVRLDRHRNTWTYSRAVATQRALVLEHRQQVETEDLAMTTLRASIGERLGRLERAGAAATRRMVRAIALHALDQRWTEHIALLQEVREGIHLRSLAGERPAEAFHRIAVREFHGFFERVYEDVATVVHDLAPDDLGRDPESLGLRRPSATWTYMVTDDPLGSPGDRFARGLGKRWRTAVLGVE